MEIKKTLLPESERRQKIEGYTFGRDFSDHMLILRFENGRWGTPEISPYQKIEFSPATSGIHYGQCIYEGMKAHMGVDGPQLFRPEKNAKRFNISAARMCMPELDEDLFVKCVKELVKIDKQFVPSEEGHSLYIRPFMFATDDYIGVRASEDYTFMIITCPVGAYYNKPLKLKLEREYTRSAEGGVGYAKTAGNYAGAMYPTMLAQQEGYDQVLWTDAITHNFIEECGTMNVAFIRGNTMVSPESGQTILDGITRDSVLKLARKLGLDVEVRKVSVDEIRDGISNGIITEMMGIGTAAAISEIQLVCIDGVDYDLPPSTENSFSIKLKKQLDDLRRGRTEDYFNWNHKIEGI